MKIKMTNVEPREPGFYIIKRHGSIPALVRLADDGSVIHDLLGRIIVQNDTIWSERIEFE